MKIMSLEMEVTHLSLYSSLWAYDCTLFSSIKNLTRWKNGAVTDGGCLRNRTSTGSLDDKHMMWSVHTVCEQHSLSEQSIIPSEWFWLGFFGIKKIIHKIFFLFFVGVRSCVYVCVWVKKMSKFIFRNGIRNFFFLLLCLMERRDRYDNNFIESLRDWWKMS